MRKLFILSLILVSTVCFSQIQLGPPMDKYYVTSKTGYREDPMGGVDENLHRGVDLVGPPGSKVKAAADGFIVEVWPPPGTPAGKDKVFEGHSTFGGLIIIKHSPGIYTLYGHLSKVMVKSFQPVKGGAVIGIQGDTGIATGVHLHFEIIIDPTLYINSVPQLETAAVLKEN